MTTDTHRDTHHDTHRDAHRTVTLTRTHEGRYQATNARGGTLHLGTGDDTTFTPVEALLAAIGGCTAVDVDTVVTRRCEPDTFTVQVGADKLADTDGHHLGPVTITFTLAFPDDEHGAQAARVAPRAARVSHERDCTVSRTVMLPTAVTTVVHTTTGTSTDETVIPTATH